MPIRDEVIGIIKDAVKIPIPDTEKHLYRDLGLDSLSFIRLLLAIEDRFNVIFEISEMQSCLDINRLVELTEKKVTGDENANA